MKATELETKRFDKALDDFIELFNKLEADDPIIHFDDEVLKNIELAKKKYGDDLVNNKINTVVGEMLSWLDLENVESVEGDTAEDEEEQNDDES